MGEGGGGGQWGWRDTRLCDMEDKGALDHATRYDIEEEEQDSRTVDVM